MVVRVLIQRFSYYTSTSTAAPARLELHAYEYSRYPTVGSRTLLVQIGSRNLGRVPTLVLAVRLH